jgi:c-di-GMP-binding flagellar brake protein YcgR
VVDGGQQGRAFGLRFVGRGPAIKRTFMGDLLRRLRYDPRQVRKELRFPLSVPVKVRAQGEELLGKTLDLSAGGARFLLPSPVETPSDGFAELTLPEAPGKSQVIELSLRFLREVPGPDGGYCYAVAFRRAQPQAHLKLSRWLATRMRVQTLTELVPELVSPPKPSEP